LTSRSRTTVSTCRRACRSPRLALVISRSASGRSRLALASVVVIRPWRNSAVARLARIRRSCAGLPPNRRPFGGVGIALLLLRLAGPVASLRVGPAGLQLLGLAEVLVDLLLSRLGGRGTEIDL